MHLHITPARLITEVQKEFNNMFPFLKLEFFQNKASNRSGFSLKNLVSHDRKIVEVQPSIKDGEVQIMEEMKVQDLEKIFKDQFGLAVQVFRRSGNLWLETTMTDSWTLRQQNEHGEEISSGVVKKNTFLPEDYDLRRDKDS